MVSLRDFDWNSLDKLTDFKFATKKHEKLRYLNYPFSFDIETSSFYIKDEKRACMYIWMFNVNGTVVYGRTWSEFEWFIDELRRRLNLSFHKRIIVYVHNLSYEFQFLVSHVNWTEVFARKKRHPIKGLANNCIEFKCSYFLSGLSLEKVAENLTSVKIEKQIGKLDYRKMRHCETPMSQDELKYCEYDVKILHYFILEEMEKNDNDITKIPLTKTGYVRRYCREYIKHNTNYKKYREQILKEAPINSDLFILLNKAFAGGYTHANCEYVFNKIENVHSIDFTSSYPAQMIAHKYPRGKFIKCKITNKREFYNLVNSRACVFEIRIQNVQSKTSHHIWSSSKCAYGTNKKYNAVIDNGRIVSSDEIYTYMTDVDFKTFSRFYEFEDFGIGNFYYTEYGYLPKEIIECVLKFYSDKTTLKDVQDKIAEYFVSKGMVNGIYGMMVTNPLNDEILFDEETWAKERPEISSALYKSYNSINQFLCYQWGVWITAWARYELLKGVFEIGDDVIYCDTDSIKFVNLQEHEDYIIEYNEYIINLLQETLIHYSIPIDAISPKDIKGNTHTLGIWTYEGMYDIFKTLGAKRYMTQTNGKIHLTVSGLTNSTKQKNNPTQYIIDNGGFDFFTHEMTIPKSHSCRLTHTYIDDKPYSAIVKDYTGKAGKINEYRYIHMEQSQYSLGMKDFIEFLIGIDNEEAIAIREKRPELQINRLDKECKHE